VGFLILISVSDPCQHRSNVRSRILFRSFFVFYVSIQTGARLRMSLRRRRRRRRREGGREGEKQGERKVEVLAVTVDEDTSVLLGLDVVPAAEYRFEHAALAHAQRFTRRSEGVGHCSAILYPEI